MLFYFSTKLTVIDMKLFLHKEETIFRCTQKFILKIKNNSVFTTAEHFPPQEMATSTNKRKLAAVSIETQGHLSNNQSKNTSVRGITEEYITQVFEKTKGRVIKKLSQDFSRQSSASWELCLS